nr:probable protein S-acyltransferase 16 [Ipomoea batatas]
MAWAGCRFSLSVSFVILLIAFLYFSTVFVFLSQWFGVWSSYGMLNAFAFTTILVFCIFNYILAMFTNPGRVPTNTDEDDNIIVQEIMPKDGDLRYCQRCSFYRPPRAHHCIKCDTCVLRMDHHCIWINNCVGHGNYKFFFISLVYAVTACLYSLVLFVGSLSMGSVGDHRIRSSHKTLYIISGLVLVPLSIVLASLLAWHIYLIYQNKTTIEVQ